jgi:hypothetical protein
LFEFYFLFISLFTGETVNDNIIQSNNRRTFVSPERKTQQSAEYNQQTQYGQRESAQEQEPEDYNYYPSISTTESRSPNDYYYHSPEKKNKAMNPSLQEPNLPHHHHNPGQSLFNTPTGAGPRSNNTPEPLSTISKFRPNNNSNNNPSPGGGSAANLLLNSGVKDNNASNLKNALRNILTDLVQRYQSSSSLPPTPKNTGTSSSSSSRQQISLIEEETEILALISLYLQNNGDPDALLLDPVLMKTLKMKVLSKLLEENMMSKQQQQQQQQSGQQRTQLKSMSNQNNNNINNLEIDSSVIESALHHYESYYNQSDQEKANSPLGKSINKNPVWVPPSNKTTVGRSPPLRASPPKTGLDSSNEEREVKNNYYDSARDLSSSENSTVITAVARGEGGRKHRLTNYSTNSANTINNNLPVHSSPAPPSLPTAVAVAIDGNHSPPGSSQKQLKQWTKASPQSESPRRKSKQQETTTTTIPSRANVTPIKENNNSPSVQIMKERNPRYLSCGICAKLPKRPTINFAEFRKEKQQQLKSQQQQTPSPSAALSSSHDWNDPSHLQFCEPCSLKHFQSHNTPNKLSSSNNNTPLSSQQQQGSSSKKKHPLLPATLTEAEEEVLAAPLTEEQEQKHQLYQKKSEETERQLQEWKNRFNQQYNQKNALTNDSMDSLPSFVSAATTNTAKKDQMQRSHSTGKLINRPTTAPPSVSSSAAVPAEVAAKAIMRSISADSSSKQRQELQPQSKSQQQQQLTTPEVNRNRQPNSAITSATTLTTPSPVSSETKGPYKITRNDPTSFSAMKRREMSRDAVREVTSKLCQLAVELEKSLVMNESIDENEPNQTNISMNNLIQSNLSQDFIREATTATATSNPVVLAEMIQLIRQQNEEINKIKDFQETLLKQQQKQQQQGKKTTGSFQKSGGSSIFSNTRQSLQSMRETEVMNEEEEERAEQEGDQTQDNEDYYYNSISQGQPLARIDEEEDGGEHEASIQQQQQQKKKLVRSSSRELESFMNFFQLSQPDYHHHDNHHQPGFDSFGSPNGMMIAKQKNQIYPMSSEDMEQVISMLEEKYHITRYQFQQFQQQTAGQQQQVLSPSGRRLSSHQGQHSVNLTSVLEIEVLLARHLPAMKHISRSSDPYVELILLTFHPIPNWPFGSSSTLSSPLGKGRGGGGEMIKRDPQGREISTTNWKENITNVLSHFTDVDYNVLNGNCVIRADIEFSIMEEVYGCSPVVIGYQRTNVQVVKTFILFYFWLWFC